MPTLRPCPPSSKSSSSALAGSIESSEKSPGDYIFIQPLPSLLATATIVILILYCYRRTHRPNQPLSYSSTYDDVPPKTAATPSFDISQWYAQLCDPNNLSPHTSTYTTREGYIENAGFDINPTVHVPTSPGALQQHIQQFEVKCNTPLPTPTIRRHSYPLDDATPKMTKYSVNTVESFGPPRLPRPWVPRRTDTVVAVNGCRRHVMVLDGEPLQRGSAG